MADVIDIFSRERLQPEGLEPGYTDSTKSTLIRPGDPLAIVAHFCSLSRAALPERFRDRGYALATNFTPR